MTGQLDARMMPLKAGPGWPSRIHQVPEEWLAATHSMR
jgi:hypothetical protein